MRVRSQSLWPLRAITLAASLLLPAASGLHAAEADFPALWDALTSDKPLPAWQAVARFAAAGDKAAQFLGSRLPKQTDVPKKVARLLQNLDAPARQQREAAAQELKVLGRRIHPLLRQALKNSESAEVRRHLKALLAAHASLPANN